MSARRAQRGRRRRAGRGFATLVVLVMLALATVVLVDLQTSAFREAASGREALARTRAYWAARGGLEAQVARLGDETERGEEVVSAFQVLDSMDRVAGGELRGARFEVKHTTADGERFGVADAHAKININRMNFDDLMELPGMTEDQAAAILDWVDTDDFVRDLGAESGYYGQLDSPYEPRNGFIRSLFELELVAGVDRLDVRGEDWNLNGRLDPNEDDGAASWPDDDEDGELDAGWSGIITTESVDEGLAVSGERRVDLLTADERQVIALVDDLDPLQARVILDYASREGVFLTDLFSTSLVAIAATTPSLGADPSAVRELEPEQLGQLLDGATRFAEEDGPIPGRVNINTADRETLDYMTSIPSGLADQLIFARDNRPEGFASIVDLLDVVGPGQLANLSRLLDVRSSAFVVSSRGRDLNTGVEVEIVATIERSALPIVVTEMRVR